MNSKNFANYGSTASERYQMSSGITPITLPGASILLLHQALNQLWNCIGGAQFESQIGIQEVEARKLFGEFDVWVNAHPVDGEGVLAHRDAPGSSDCFERVFGAMEIRALRNALEVVMLDLGQGDFFTCTGFSLAEAKLLLDQLNSLLMDPLHLKNTAESAAH